MKQVSIAITLLIFLPIVVGLPELATAATKGCLSIRTIQALSRGVGGNFMLFDPGDRTANQSGPINIREQPSVNARVLYVAASRNPVDILQQVEGKDGYCWLKVRVITNQSTAQSVARVTGWVRGDLVKVGVD
ncbi:MAG: SH3 domain-containing protein [Leptolyngbyaceae cyanobacterium bins.59]|nr:SH3 domain-containing protein [Leptolyngbyaceae cyanobacterium bins.59]